MPYIGNQPGTGTRNRFIYTATASQTTFSGADDNGKTLKYSDGDYIDVYLNGICLVPVVDYTATSKTSVVLIQAASLNDTLEVVAYDIATISDTVSKADGGNFEAGINVDGNIGIRTTSPSDDIEINPSADEKGITLKTTSSIRPYLNFDANRSGANQQVMRIQGKWNGTTITRIESITGDDTTNKDNGYITFQTASDSSNLNERMRIAADGVVTIPNQPAFNIVTTQLMNISTSTQQIASSSNVWASDVPAGSGVNIGSHFSSSTGRFTAPVAGQYIVHARYTLDDFTSGYFYTYIYKNTTAISTVQHNQQTNIQVGSHAVVLTLAANDYVTFQYVNNYTGHEIGYVSFSGHMIG